MKNKKLIGMVTAGIIILTITGLVILNDYWKQKTDVSEMVATGYGGKKEALAEKEQKDKTTPTEIDTNEADKSKDETANQESPEEAPKEEAKETVEPKETKAVQETPKEPVKKPSDTQAKPQTPIPAPSTEPTPAPTPAPEPEPEPTPEPEPAPTEQLQAYGTVRTSRPESINGVWGWENGTITYTWNVDQYGGFWLQSYIGNATPLETWEDYAELAFPRPSREGTYEGEAVSQTIWVWLD